MARKKKAALTDALTQMREAREDVGEEPQMMSLLDKSTPPPKPIAQTQKKPREKKVDTARITLHLKRENLERARGAMAWAIIKGREDIRSMSQLFDRALARELEILRDELKPEGGEFAPMKKTPTKGRPPGT